jgi:PAS domain S-box-containing protein
MSTNPLIDDEPVKLVYFGSDPDGESLVRSMLTGAPKDKYEIMSVSSMNKIEAVDMGSFCHAVILDIRDGHPDEAAMIEWVGEKHSPVALICLCKDFEQIQKHNALLHWVNDIVVADSLQEGELPVRINRAIRIRECDFQRRQSQELFNALLNNMPDSIYFKDRDCRFIRVNNAKASKHHESPEQMVGKSDFDYFTEERARPSFQEEQTMMRSGEPVLGEIQKLTFDDGSVGWVNTSKLPLTDKFGRVIGTMGISRDVTEQIENQRKLEEAQRMLDEAK